MSKLDQENRDANGATNLVFSKQRKDPIENDTRAQVAMARFNQVKGVIDK